MIDPMGRKEAIFPARLKSLTLTASFAQTFCDSNHIARDDALRLRVILEELFANSIQHGYGAECAPSKMLSTFAKMLNPKT